MEPDDIEAPTEAPVEEAVHIPPAKAKLKAKLKPTIDLDAAFDAALEAAEADVVYVPANFRGKEWRVAPPQNAYRAIRASDFANDPSALTDLMLEYIHPDERAEFAQILRVMVKLPFEALMTLFNSLSEAASARPTGPSGA